MSDLPEIFSEKKCFFSKKVWKKEKKCLIIPVNQSFTYFYQGVSNGYFK